MHELFISCPIGLEKILHAELSHLKLVNAKLEIQTGGLSLCTANLEQALVLNYWLKTANRILLRVKKQKCRDLPKLYQILSKINWGQFLTQENISFSVTSHKSRLLHTKRIEDSATEAIIKYFKDHPLAKFHADKQYPEQKIFILLNNDELTVSLDTTGEHLHKRGRSHFRGKAGLRETIASACLNFLSSEDSQKSLLDPMCGSGTFLSEYYYQKSPTLDRTYSFENWKVKTTKPNPLPIEPRKVVGFDKDQKVIETLNMPYAETKVQDFFKLTSSPCELLIMNPPYGKRIKIEGNKNQYFQDLVKKLKDLSPERAGIIIPKPYSTNIKADRRLSFKQNGIAVEFLVFEF